MKLIYILLCLFIIVSCSSNNVDYNGRFAKDVNKIFKNYSYEIESIGNKSYYNMVTLTLDKKNISYNELPNLAKIIQKNNWNINYNLDGYYWVFCRKGNESIVIYYPNERIVKDKQGNYIRGDLSENKIYIWISYYRKAKQNKEYRGCS